MSKKNGYCYVIYCEGFNDWCKVGFTTRKVKQRLKEYQTYSPFTYELIFECEFDNAHKAEQEVHKRLLAVCEKRKEWFKVSPKFASNIIEGVKEELDTWGEYES